MAVTPENLTAMSLANFSYDHRDTPSCPQKKLTLKQQRAEHLNQVIRIIADHCRRFFYSQASNRYASM